MRQYGGQGNEPFWKSRRLQGSLLVAIGAGLTFYLPEAAELIGYLVEGIGVSFIGASWRTPLKQK